MLGLRSGAGMSAPGGWAGLGDVSSLPRGRLQGCLSVLLTWQLAPELVAQSRRTCGVIAYCWGVLSVRHALLYPV